MTTRPTADELKNLDPGRYFTARLRKKASIHDGVTAYTSYGNVVTIPNDDITHIEPAQLKVGDRVTSNGGDPNRRGVIIGVNDGMAWVRWRCRDYGICALDALEPAR